MRTTGTEQGGGTVLARRGEILLGDATEPYGIAVELSSFSDKSDPALLEEVRARFAQQLVKGSECGHLQASVRCASDWCITNVMTSASCANVAPSGVANCRIVSPGPPQPQVIQTPSLLPNGGCPTGGNPVNYATLFTTYDGCNGCTPTAGTPHDTACDVANCPAGASLNRCASPRGIRRACS